MRLPAQIADALRRQAHRTLKKVTDDHADYHWNTMIAALMELTNRLIRLRGTDVVDEPEWDEAIGLLLLMLAPIAPHISEELWAGDWRRAARSGRRSTPQRWPEYDETLIAETQIELPIQVNGKLRDLVSVPAGLSEIEIEQIVMARDKIRAAARGPGRRARHPGTGPPRQRGDRARADAGRVGLDGYADHLDKSGRFRRLFARTFANRSADDVVVRAYSGPQSRAGGRGAQMDLPELPRELMTDAALLAVPTYVAAACVTTTVA